jgi:hypothetical protein
MWTAWVVAAIALAGALFMLRFLMALLSEEPPSVGYWVVPMRRAPEKERHLAALRGMYFDGDYRGLSDGAGCGELPERENYAKEEFHSGLIAFDAFDVRPVAGFESGSIHPRRGRIFRERRL